MQGESAYVAQAKPAQSAGYHVRISRAAEQPDWDAFVRAAVGGNYLQTSLWGRVKARQGWQATRLLVSQGERIVAGVQLLTRGLPLLGSIGYVLYGPMFAVDDPELTGLLLDALRAYVGANRVQYLVLQPPWNGHALVHRLPAWGYRPCSVRSPFTATLLIDLSPDLDVLFGQLRTRHRQYVRKAQRTGIAVREGTESDLATFYRLYLTTSRRQNFVPLPEAFFRHVWHVLSPAGHIKLFLTEYKDEVISSDLAIPFGDTLHRSTTGWSGAHKNLGPNEALVWAEIVWAKTQGYRYYNLEWVDPQAAKSIVQGEPVTEAFKHSADQFKLGFGGQATLVPGSFDCVRSRYLGPVFRAGVPMIGKSSSARNGINRVFTRLGGAPRTNTAEQKRSKL